VREIPSVNIAGVFKESILAHDPESLPSGLTRGWIPVFGKDHAPPMILAHDPEKWIPVFGQDHAPPMILAHDPEKWIPVFGQDHAPPMILEWDDGADRRHHTLADYRGCDAEASRQSGFG
jgi:hypothetical protein